jgi:hypothetical protein
MQGSLLIIRLITGSAAYVLLFMTHHLGVLKE